MSDGGGSLLARKGRDRLLAFAMKLCPLIARGSPLGDKPPFVRGNRLLGLLLELMRMRLLDSLGLG